MARWPRRDSRQPVMRRARHFAGMALKMTLANDVHVRQGASAVYPSIIFLAQFPPSNFDTRAIIIPQLPFP